MTGTPAGRQTFAVIDPTALRDNYTRLRSATAADVAMMAIVKANAYGHGATLVAPILQEAGVDWFGVATVGEAVELRSAGISKPILVLTGASAREVSVLLKQRLATALLDASMARELSRAAGAATLPVHLKIDSGMGRLGLRPEELGELLRVLRELGNLSVEGVFSHFGTADDVNHEYPASQIARFEEALELVAEAGFAPRWVHLANSAATLSRPEAHYTMIRPGIALYGIVPPGVAHTEVGGQLRPAMRLVTHVLQVKDLPAEYPVSYGQTFVTRRPSRIAVLPIGYADGYGRSLSNKGYVLVRGTRVPVVGNVCMDLTMIDVTDIPDVAPGEEVVLWGEQAGKSLSVDEVAGWQGTISYEVINRIGKRVPRLQAAGS